MLLPFGRWSIKLRTMAVRKTLCTESNCIESISQLSTFRLSRNVGGACVHTAAIWHDDNVDCIDRVREILMGIGIKLLDGLGMGTIDFMVSLSSLYRVNNTKVSRTESTPDNIYQHSQRQNFQTYYTR